VFVYCAVGTESLNTIEANFFFEGLKMSTYTYDVDFLQQCSLREVTVRSLTENECFCTARAMAVDMELVLLPRSR